LPGAADDYNIYYFLLFEFRFLLFPALSRKNWLSFSSFVKVEVDAPIISDSGIEVINELTAVVADAAVIDILHHDDHGDRVRVAAVDPIAFRYIHKAPQDVEVCKVSLEMRVLALDVPRILDEDTLVRPKALKANLGQREGSREPLSYRLARCLGAGH